MGKTFLGFLYAVNRGVATAITDVWSLHVMGRQHRRAATRRPSIIHWCRDINIKFLHTCCLGFGAAVACQCRL